MKMSGAESAIATLLAQNRYTAIVSAAFSKDEVTLISLEGSEELGTSFHYRVTFVSRRRIRNFADVIGQPMTVGLKLADGKTRFFNGIVAEFSYTGLDDTRRPIYVADLVPYLNVLKLRRNSRVFQNANAASIVKQIFSEYQKCNFKDLTSTTLAAREYCVQYNETDYDFVNRLLEREGIYYYFLHYADRHELVLVDGPGGHKPCTPAAIRTNLSLENDRFQDDIFWSWRETVALRSTEVVLKDYNFEIPLAQLTSAAPVAPVGTGGVPILDEELAFDRISTGEGRRNKKDVVSANDGPIRQLFVFPGGV
ncbi:type VI secretion system Vgr family protein [Ensifer adhaerens]